MKAKTLSELDVAVERLQEEVSRLAAQWEAEGSGCSPEQFNDLLDFNDQRIWGISHLFLQVNNGGIQQWIDNGYWTLEISAYLKSLDEKDLASEIDSLVKQYSEIEVELHHEDLQSPESLAWDDRSDEFDGDFYNGIGDALIIKLASTIKK